MAWCMPEKKNPILIQVEFKNIREGCKDEEHYIEKWEKYCCE